MDEVVLRFPMIADKILKNLDNVTLTNCKYVSRQWCDFISDQRTELLRKIQKYIDPKNKYYEDWKKVLKKAPISILKEVVSAIEKRQSLRDRELWKFTTDNKLVNKSGPWKYSDVTWTNSDTINLNKMSRIPTCLQDVQTNQVLSVVGNEVLLEAKDENSYPHLKFKTSHDDPFSDLERAFADTQDPNRTSFKLSIQKSDDPDFDCDQAKMVKANPKKRRQLWRKNKARYKSEYNEGWFTITNSCKPQNIHDGILTVKDASTLTLGESGGYGIIENSESSPHKVATHLGHPSLYQYVSEKLGIFNPILGKKLNWTAFHIAAERGHSEICRYIMQNISDKNPAADVNHWTPLHLAIENGHLDTLNVIMEYADDKNPYLQRSKWNNGETALQKAMWKNLLGQNEEIYYCMETTLMSLGIKYHPNFDLSDENHIMLRLKHQKNCKLCTSKDKNSNEASASRRQIFSSKREKVQILGE